MALRGSGDDRLLCECGCGCEIMPWRDFRPGHNLRLSNPVDDPKVRAKISEGCRLAYVNTPGLYESVVNQLREATETRWSTPGAREHASEVTSRTAKAVWGSYTSEEKLARLRAGVHSSESLRRSQEASRRGFSTTEGELNSYLEEDFPGLFFWNKNKEECIGGCFPDFISQSLGLVIECFGDYWHGQTPGEEEAKREFYSGLGFPCLVVWANTPMDVTLQWSEISAWIRQRPS